MIIGAQKTSHNLNMKVCLAVVDVVDVDGVDGIYVQFTKGQGVRHVVYWRHSTDQGVQLQPLKVNLILYDNDVLQVKEKPCTM